VDDEMTVGGNTVYSRIQSTPESNLHTGFGDYVTIALKPDAMPEADESYQHCEAGLSQKACAISSETNSRLSC
jgi:hypothetical protein